jgi:hypothetical protein
LVDVGQTSAMVGQDLDVSRPALVADLRVVRQNGLLKLGSLDLDALTSASARCFPDAIDAPHAIEQLLRLAISRLDGDEIRESAGVLFGVVAGYKGRKPNELRDLAAKVQSVNRDTFRRGYEPTLLNEMAGSIVIALAELGRDAASDASASPEAESDLVRRASITTEERDQPPASAHNSEVTLARIGRVRGWEEMFVAAPIIRAVDLSMPLLGNPGLIDRLDQLTRTGSSDIRIMLLNPSMPPAQLRRSSPAYKTLDELQTTIEYVVKILKGLRQTIEKHGANAANRFDVRLSHTLPSFCGVLAGDCGYVNIYMEHLTGSRGPYLELVRDQTSGQPSLLSCFEESFDTQWNRSPSLFAAGLDDHHARMLAFYRAVLDEPLPEYLYE